MSGFQIDRRQALALGLDVNDDEVRTRLIEKMNYLTQDLADPEPSSEQELRQFYEASPDVFTIPSLVSFDQVFFKPTDWIIKPGYSINVLYWTNENDLYYFETISFPFMMLLAYPLSPSLTIRIEGGIVISSTLESDRKQNVEAGYPDRFNGNLRINMVYKLPNK